MNSIFLSVTDTQNMLICTLSQVGAGVGHSNEPLLQRALDPSLTWKP